MAENDWMNGMFEDIIQNLSDKHNEIKAVKGTIAAWYHDLKKRPYLIAFVGGGEIAIEIAHVANQLAWNLMCFDEPQGYTNEEEKKWQIPMSKFGLFEGIKDLDNQSIILEGLSTPHYNVKEDPVVSLERHFSDKNPDVILLEKNFIPIVNWTTLQSIMESKRADKKIHFIPSKDLAQIFTNKIEMKKKLTEKLGSEFIVENKELDISNIENSSEEIEIEIETFLQEHGNVILKPAISESGLGQSEINSKLDIEQAILKLTMGPLNNQKMAIVEKKIDFITEAYVATFRPISDLDCSPTCVGPISYKKKPIQLFGGPVRLIESEYPIDNKIINKQIIEKIMKITNEICNHFKTPFLGIEFFICSDDRIFINEIVWRPDDAGFITLLSHSKDQFQLFMESLTSKQIIEPKENVGEFKCIALLRDQPLPYQFSGSQMNGNDYKFHFYHKSFPNTLNKKIVGYAIANIGDGCSYQTMDEFKKDILHVVLAEYYDDESERKNFYFSDE